ncbi:MAG: hypothetical protein HN390_04715 [Anaerolineae bacterium]|jgi:hypothetical protein|nr:hypothetical protein [Anaerolineae bacterium]MBT7190839.1 hypothetical protein [Anaerolineae bacterium]MBT7991590.1 hypothetical protein [Anaerolineae bacterium]
MKRKEPNHHKDYSFAEWENLPFKTKRDIWNNYWNPYQPDKGKRTRDAILNEFKRQHLPLVQKAVVIDYGYFGWGVGGISVIMPESSIRVPTEFASVMINKGVIQEKIDEKTVMVNWRYGGSKATFTLDTSEGNP